MLPMYLREELFGTPGLLVELGQNMIEMPNATDHLPQAVLQFGWDSPD